MLSSLAFVWDEAHMNDSWPPGGIEREEAGSLLLDLHERLHLHLKELRDERAQHGGKVYLIEHGLDEPELQTLTRAVKVAFYEHEDSSKFWRRRSLPLLVVATEVGYRYRGTGTDYWPRFTRALGGDVEDDHHRWLVELFKRAERITGVSPPDTAWAGHFHLIAWPITHALLPVELHTKLLQAILKHPLALGPKTPTPELMEPLIDWAERASNPRLAAFLEQREAAAAVVRHFLEIDGSAWLTLEPSFLERASADLRDNAGAVRELKAARRKQRYLSRCAAEVEPKAYARHWAPFVLDHAHTDTARRSLWLAPPPLPPTLRRGLTERLSPRARCRLLEGRRVGLSEVASGQPIELRCRALPSAEPDGGVPVVGDLPADTPRQLELHLTSLRADVARPLLFADHVGPSYGAQQVRRRAVYSGPTWWVLADPTTPAPAAGGGIARRAEVAGLSLFEARPESDQDFAWLRERGLPREHRPLISIVGSAPLSHRSAVGAAYAPDDVVALILERGELRAPQSDEAITSRCSLLDLSGREGSRTLQLQNPDGSEEQIALEVCTPPEPEPLIDIAITAPDLTVGSLRRRQVAVTVSADLPFAGLPLRLVLSADDTPLSVAYAGPLPALPHVVGAAHPCWEGLQRAALSATDRALELRVEVGAVATRRLIFEPSPWSVAWVSRADADALAEGVERVSFLASAPLKRCPSPDRIRDSFRLSQLRHAASGIPVAGAGVVSGPPSLSPDQLEAPAKPRLLRRLDDASSSDRQGAWDLAMAHVSWSTAEGEGLLAESVRARTASSTEAWLVEALCGTRWRQVEAALPGGAPLTLGEHVARELSSRGLGRDEYADVILSKAGIQDPTERLDAIRAVQLNERLSFIRDLVAAGPEDGGFEALNELLNRSYERAFGQLGRQADPDLYHSADELFDALRAACARWEQAAHLTPLIPVMRPRWLALQLAELPFETSPPQDLIAPLHGLLRSKRAAPVRWDERWVGALVDLFIRPAKFPLDDTGRHAIGAALVDRGAARAVRYVVLRSDMAATKAPVNREPER